MKRSISMKPIVTMLLVFFLSCSAVYATAPLADRVPANAIYYTGSAGRTMAFDGSNTGQLLQELPLKEIRETFDKIIQTKVTADRQAKVITATTIDMVLMALSHPAAMYMEDVADDRPVGAMIVELGRDRDAFAAKLETIISQLVDSPFEIKKTVNSGITYRTINVDGELVVHFGFIGDMFFYAFGQNAVDNLIALRDSSDTSLLNSSAFASAFEQVDGDNVQSAWFLDTDKALSLIDSQLVKEGKLEAGELAMNMDLLGLGKLGPLVAASRIVDRRIHTRIRIASPAPHEGVMKLFSVDSASSDVSDLPLDTEMLLMGNIDLKALLSELRRITAMKDPRHATSLEQGIQMASSYLGFSLEDQILSNLGPRVMLVQSESLGGPFAGIVLMVDIKDVEAMAKLRTRLENMAMGFAQVAGMQGGKPPFRLVKAALGDGELTSLHFTEEPIPLAPSWTISGDKLIISAWPQPVMTLAKNELVLGFNATDAFTSVRKTLSGEPVMMSYLDSSRVLPRLYPFAMMFSSAMANGFNKEGIAASAAWLPTLESLRKYALPGICAMWSDQNGIVIESEGQSIGIPAAALGMSIAMPAMGRARQLARESGSMANLRAIGQAVVIYEQDNRDNTPQSLTDLISEAALDVKITRSPVTNRVYNYIPVPVNAGDNLIMAYEQLRDGQVLVLLRNGAVMKMSYSSFRPLLDSSRAAASPANPANPANETTPATRPRSVTESDF